MMDPLTRPVQAVKHRTRRKPLSVEIQRTYQTLVVLLILIGGTSMALFLYMNSLKPAKGYTLKQLQVDHELLSSESRKLDHQVIEAQSFIHLEEEELVESMTEMEQDEFSYAESESGYAYNE
jgi:hypothetical protein